jgi:ABC transporter transmembrane region 2
MNADQTNFPTAAGLDEDMIELSTQQQQQQQQQQRVSTTSRSTVAAVANVEEGHSLLLHRPNITHPSSPTVFHRRPSLRADVLLGGSASSPVGRVNHHHHHDHQHHDKAHSPRGTTAGMNHSPRNNNRQRLPSLWPRGGHESDDGSDGGPDSDKNANRLVSHNKLPEMDTDTPAMQWKRIRQQFGLFVQLAKPYFVESVASRWLLARVIVVTLAYSATTIVFSYVIRDFWNALADKKERQFYRVLVRFVLVLIVASPVTTLYTYCMEQFAVHWCEWMTTRTFDWYGANTMYYKLEQYQKAGHRAFPSTTNATPSDQTVKIDNPDQRITEDVHLFTSLSIKLSVMLGKSVIDLISFGAILWSIYPALFGAAFIYATIGTIVTALLGRKLIRLQFQQSQRDADLRYALVRLRENAESVAFYRAEDREGHVVQVRIARAMHNRRNINVAIRNLEFFTQTYWFTTEVLPIVVMA